MTRIVPQPSWSQHKKKTTPKLEQLQSWPCHFSLSRRERHLAWIRTTSQTCGDELGHFANHNHFVITTYQRFFEAESAHLSICWQHTSCNSPQSPSNITNGGTPWKLQACWNERHSSENIDSLRKPEEDRTRASRFGGGVPNHYAIERSMQGVIQIYILVLAFTERVAAENVQSCKMGTV